MMINVVTYNMGMGASREPHLSTLDECFKVFRREFADLAKSAPDEVWFFCVQEIVRYQFPEATNQVEKLQDYLNDHTGMKWWKHSKTRDMGNGHSNPAQEAVAIFSNRDLVKEQKYDIGHGRAGQAVKAKLSSNQYVWVVTAHLIKGGSDDSGSKRESEIEHLLEHVVTFDPTYPIIFTGDFNVEDVARGTTAPDDPADPRIYERTVGKLERLSFIRGTDFTPVKSDTTKPAWDASHYSLIDYIFVNTAGVCTPQRPATLNFRIGMAHYASDHKGVHLRIDYPAP